MKQCWSTLPIQPEETFAQGIVQLAVNETPVSRVQVVGAEHHSLAVVRSQVPSVVEGQPINFKALQRDIAQANRVADRTVDPAFRPGQVPGTLDGPEGGGQLQPPWPLSVERHRLQEAGRCIVVNAVLVVPDRIQRPFRGMKDGAATVEHDAFGFMPDH